MEKKFVIVYNLETNRDWQLAIFIFKYKPKMSSVLHVHVLLFYCLIIEYCIHHVQCRDRRSSFT